MDLCNLQGNTDMYGLGIRLGFYFQWLSQIITSVLLAGAQLPVDAKRLKSLKTEIEGGQFALQCFLWFWAAKAQQDGDDGCPRFGFLFSKLFIGSRGLRCVNVLVQSLILAIALLMPVLALIFGDRWDQLPKRPERRSRLLPFLNAFIAALALGVTVVAVELTIFWNGLQDVHSVDSAGQLIPLVIGVVVFFRIPYKYFWAEDIEKAEEGIVNIIYPQSPSARAGHALSISGAYGRSDDKYAIPKSA
ncbi:hypothetical protein O1611_g6383 [Lasiodiplodia mahajangana]|uniref:Uncharacterized protein n=1 Tax=Lasiodiplodia mahajangana TaxID=1108764 RepID=A0ACC2JIQ8_9PEZI|nr:hypothetical protein O1611_g6383 [Lasiodiplodia mahajangana]